MHTLQGREAPQAAAMGAIGSSSGVPEELPIGPSRGVYVWVRSGTDAAQPSQRHGERMGLSTHPLASSRPDPRVQGGNSGRFREVPAQQLHRHRALHRRDAHVQTDKEEGHVAGIRHDQLLDRRH